MTSSLGNEIKGDIEKENRHLIFFEEQFQLPVSLSEINKILFIVTEICR
jgi:hypothetical protein